MPHATDSDRDADRASNASDDDQEFGRALAALGGTGEDAELAEMLSREGQGQGEKADDAQDYMDIDLSDEDDLDGDETGNLAATEADGDLDDLFGADAQGNDDGEATADKDFDDLFGDDDGDLPAEETSSSAQAAQRKKEQSFGSTTVADSSFEQSQSRLQAGEVAISDDEAEDEQDEDLEDPAVLLQRRLMAGLPAVDVNEDVFAEIWPLYEKDRPLRFNQILAPKRAYYTGKTPLKPPRPVQPTKLTLEIQQDQEKSFKLPGTATTAYLARRAEAEANGIVLTQDSEPLEEESEDEGAMEQLDEETDIGGVGWQDLVALCEDWNVPSEATPPRTSEVDDEDAAQIAKDWDMTASPATKRTATEAFIDSIVPQSSFGDYFDDPEAATKRLAKRVRLDLNDPRILVDIRQPELQPKRRRIAGTFKRDATGGLTRDFARRYNISNDEAYELLKENHQSKIRSNLGGVAIEHAMPAIRLQYPFYKVKLNNREARSFHRPALAFPYIANIFPFQKSKYIKKKHLKGRETHDIFQFSRDLSLCDNSNILLLEYSEEYPIMLSSFGMGSKLINYYRRKDDQDTSRPREDLGETSVLLPEDKSPFSIFGDVDPGQVVPTIHNAMYRAPVFRHEPTYQDFVAVSSKTGVDGRQWYLRKVENLHVVGQEFPSVEVPGTHSRKVTDAAKKRLRMLSYRMYRKHGKVKNEPLLRHLPGTDLAQNRSKMREFMEYDKDKGWLPKRGEPAPDEATIRSWIKPEDICLLESMQVGDRQLQDAGYNKDHNDSDDDDEQAQSLDQQLAPWQITKNFLNACQGKAMVTLHGEGDPSGRGEAFNLIRTSMKGGYKEIGESVEDRLDAKRQKELGGHQYNVAKQQRAYNDAIRRIWDAQAASLSSNVEYDDYMDVDEVGEDAESHAAGRGQTPSVAGSRPRRDDETQSIMSKTSTGSQSGKVMKITRRHKNKYTGKMETHEEIVRDSRIWREYLKRKRAIKLQNMTYVVLSAPGKPYNANRCLDSLAWCLQAMRKLIAWHAKSWTTSSPSSLLARC